MIPKPNIKVHLHVQEGSHNGNSDHINVTASNDEVYSYMYTGGNHGSGHGKVVLYVGCGGATIDVDVTPRSRYTIVDIECRDDLGQLTCAKESDTEWSITDACTAEMNAYYKVIVGDRQSKGTTIACDPMITNQPR